MQAGLPTAGLYIELCRQTARVGTPWSLAEQCRTICTEADRALTPGDGSDIYRAPSERAGPGPTQAEGGPTALPVSGPGPGQPELREAHIGAGVALCDEFGCASISFPHIKISDTGRKIAQP